MLLQLAHEGSHGLLSRSRRANQILASVFCAYPIGVFFDGYKAAHIQHHAWTNTEMDPASDREKYRIPNCKDWRLYALLLKNSVGLTAFGIFFAYGNGPRPSKQKAPTNQNASRLASLGKLCLVQAVLMTLLFQWDIRSYLLLWIFPAISPHMFLMRIRGIAEHGLAGQLGVTVGTSAHGNFHTRSFLLTRAATDSIRSF